MNVQPRDKPLLWPPALMGALAVWLGFPNDFVNVPPLILLWPAALALLGRRAADPLAALRWGWLTSLAGGAAALYWLAMPVHNVGGLPWLLAVPCALFIAACLASASGLFSLAAHLLRDRPPLFAAVLLALIWYLLESAYALALGFPWLPLAGALAVWPLLVQAADLVGAYALGGLWVLVVLLCLAMLPGRPDGARNRQAAESDARLWLCPAMGLALAVLLLAYGGWRLHGQPFTAEPAGGKSLAVLFVEGNIDQNQKWLPAFQRQTVELYLTLTQKALDERPDQKPLVIWPETALPFFFEIDRLYAPRIRELAARAQSPLLLGAPGIEPRAGAEPAIFNRAFLLGPDGATLSYYDKEHLVPFGEYLPDWLNWGFLSALLQGVGVYETGTAVAPLRYGNLALGMLICYEGIFPWLAQSRVEDGADILVDISNDGWFGRTPASRQHLYLTALRGVEQNRWILRGTNTGISAVVDPRGRLAMRGNQFQAETLWARAGLVATPSLYHLIAPLIFPIAALLCLALLIFGPKGSKPPHGKG